MPFRMLLLMLVAMAVAAPSAQAQFGVVRDDDPFQDGWIAQTFADDDRLATDAYSNTGGGDHDPYPVAGTGTGVYELAGGHPFIGVTDFTFRRESPDGPPAGGNVGHLRVDIPRGLMPNPGQFATCTDEQLDTLACPRASQIGTERMTVYIEALAPLVGDVTLQVPLYNMTPLSNPNDDGDQVDVPARFGFNPAEAAERVVSTDPLPNPLAPLLDALAGLHPVHIVGGVRDKPEPQFGPFDYGLYFTIDHLPAYDSGSPASPGVLRSNLTFWGVPGDVAGHDAERGVSCIRFETNALLEPGCTTPPPPATPLNPNPDPDTPFLTTPTTCTGTDLVSRLSVWSHTEVLDQIDELTPGVVDVDDQVLKHGAQGCLDNVPFGGGLEVDPQDARPDSPSGAAVSLLVPQEGLHDKGTFATSHVKDVSVTLPPGMTINPSAANGLEACTDAQLAVDTGTPGGDACPDASDIGDTSVSSPALPDELTGNAYVGQPLAGDRYRLFVTLEGRGVAIRLKGSVRPDPATGQITANFADNPELPFEDLTVDFEDGPRAPLATPLDCGAKTAAARLTAWSGAAPVAPSSAPFSIAGDGCPAGFQPAFDADTVSPLAGAFSPFTARIARADANQFLSRVRVDTPPGLAGMISRVEQCADALAESGACPAGSRVGTATTTAGAGSEPYRLTGPVYFTGPYKGAPFGMVAVIRAIAGPYDLGTVVVRQSVFVDPEDAHVSVVSDPLPQILEGVPIRLRTVDVALDKPGFVYNPTSCGTKGVRGTLHSIDGSAIGRDANLQIENCQALAFGPKLSLQLTGPKQMGFRRHPGIRARVTQPSGQANIGRAVVKLPGALALDPANARSICGFEAAQKANCPAASRIGNATAVSPALHRPLTGPVYFVQGIRIDPNTGARIRTLPSLLARLGGEIRVNLRGVTSVEGRKLVSTFERVPDAPVSRFDLNLKGGKGGVIVVSARRGACGRRQISISELTGHNAKRAASRVNMVKPCARPKLKIKRARAAGSRLAVRGTIARSARGKIKAAIRCGKTRVVKAAKRPRKGRWAVGLKLRGSCSDAGKAKLRVSYPGGGKFRPAVGKRTVTLP